MSAVEKIIEIAKAEVGYLEKKTKSSLESKTDNAGSNNFTKYARDIYPSLQGQAWCDMFVDWCFVQAFGLVKAKQLLGGFSAYTPTSAQYFKKCWQVINNHKYYFNNDGYAVTGWQEIGGNWYYFEPRSGHPSECALYLTNSEGRQDVGIF